MCTYNLCNLGTYVYCNSVKHVSPVSYAYAFDRLLRR